SARSHSKPARGAREAGPHSICGGGPSAELSGELSTTLSRTYYLHIAGEANRRGAQPSVALPVTYYNNFAIAR
ncbi:hypothetical protein JG687_00001290, partial [Phytophthora cactorum]